VLLYEVFTFFHRPRLSSLLLWFGLINKQKLRRPLQTLGWALLIVMCCLKAWFVHSSQNLQAHILPILIYTQKVIKALKAKPPAVVVVTGDDAKNKVRDNRFEM
jgi:hypothetical protein